jgi:phosphatidylinositol alpha 1,6-mannosyltransferase
MAAAIPVVSSDGAGSAWVVREAGAGILLSDPSPDALRGAIDRLLGDAGLRREMGERGRAASARFSVEASVQAVIDSYERALRSTARVRALATEPVRT